MRNLAAALLLALALPAAPARPDPVPDVLTVARPAGPEWFGIYLLGKKGGWSWSEIRKERRGAEAVLVARAETVLEATLEGKPVRRRQRDEKVFEAKPQGRLIAFSSEREGDGGSRKVEGRCTPSGCKVLLTTGAGARESRELPPLAETAEQADAARLAAVRRGVVKGTQLEPEQLRERKMKDEFLRREPLAGAGVEEEVAVVAESEEGDRVAALYKIADDGRVVEIRFGEALVARAEPEEIARRLDKVDLFNLSRVALPGPLTQQVPATIAFRLKGLPQEFHAEDPRQQYEALPDGETRVTVRARAPAAAAPGRDAKRIRFAPPALKELLASTPEIDADHPGIRKLAAQSVGKVPGVYAASAKLVDVVYRRLEKAYGASHDRASEVLRAGRGDCTEHAILFVALARAAGVPSRVVHGLVYAQYQDRVPALYWHAWAEVKAGEEWIAVDPTFGQPVADATHVALGRGTQVDTVGLLGALSVVEAKELPGDL